MLTKAFEKPEPYLLNTRAYRIPFNFERAFLIWSPKPAVFTIIPLNSETYKVVYEAFKREDKRIPICSKKPRIRKKLDRELALRFLSSFSLDER